MNTKLVQAAVLENWYGIDYVLFGDKKAKDVLSEELFEQYVSMKSALLHNLFEIFMKIGYEPDRVVKTVKEMREYASHSAALAKSRVKSNLDDESTISEMQKEIQEAVELLEMPIEEARQYIPAKRFATAAIDSLIFTEALSGNKACTACLTDWNGKVMIGSHKSFRDKLVDIVI